MSRVGKTKRPSYRILVQEKGRDPQGNNLEVVGTYDPLTKPKKLTLVADRIKYWLSKGAQPSATIRNILIDQKIIEGEKVKAHPTHKPVVEEKKA